MRTKDGTRPADRSAVRSIFAIMLTMVVIAGACGSEEAEDDPVSAESTESGSAETTALQPTAADGDTWPAEVAEFLEYELQRREVIAMSGALAGRQGDTTGEIQWQIACTWVTGQTALLRAAQPTPPASAGAEWSNYLAATNSYWTEYENACTIYDDDAGVFDADPTFRDTLWASEEPQFLSCEALLVALEPILPSVPFCRYPNNVGIPIETFPDLPDELEEFLIGGSEPGPGAQEPQFVEIEDPTAEPTMGIAGPEVWVVLWDEANTFRWFDPVFTITSNRPWQFFSEPDFISFANNIDDRVDGSLNILAPSGIADPAQRVSYEEWDANRDLPTIPVPDDLTEWIDEMPIVGTSTQTTIGGIDATYWLLEYDRESEGSSVVAVAPQSELRSYGMTLGEEVLHLWHIHHPDGPLFIVETEFSGAPDAGCCPLMTTPAMLDAISF